ncbi:hypothetical protein THASP1DRAFT_29175 [Thamnocephalis sphaerospora]|uniref:F-box domain-containing protein n=1 Tax=Thamnocephalis sphaerospora TaxID=78915 RepID=A0A4P9XSB2_9FUNG|nr:hypothetical protein THASP1DRAFT_29175 [Thamnocephalis sphaerospora]|eukprot:RKP09024.1 hypothetical protein THASP1DRAFT_29175 [Thamnocephalis sphaerospora]
MNRIPNEVLDLIITLEDDDAALVVLSCTSRWLRSRVAFQQELWRRRYARHFPHNDKSEMCWLSLHIRTQRAIELRAGHGAGGLAGPCQKVQLDWFNIYCQRRAIEYRWRNGKYVMLRSSSVSEARPRGARLQSIPFAFSGDPPENATVASQRLQPSQERPTWALERLRWRGISTRHAVIEHYLHSDHYLAIVIRHLKKESAVANSSSLYVWHFSALHRSPRIIATDGRNLRAVEVYNHWLIGQYSLSAEAKQTATVVYDLARNTRCADILGEKSDYCVQSTTADGVRIVCTDYALDGDLVTITYKLWQIVPDRAAPFQCQATGKTKMYRGVTGPRRVDNNRFFLWTNSGGAKVHNLVLLEICDRPTGTLLKEKWSARLEIWEPWSIVAHNLLCVMQEKAIVFLSLHDGSVVRDIPSRILNCWSASGLYPVRSQWAKMTPRTKWHDPQWDPALNLRGMIRVASSPTALFFTDDTSLELYEALLAGNSSKIVCNSSNVFTIIDYTADLPIRSASSARPTLVRSRRLGQDPRLPLTRSRRLGQEPPASPKRPHFKIGHTLARLAAKLL